MGVRGTGEVSVRPSDKSQHPPASHVNLIVNNIHECGLGTQRRTGLTDVTFSPWSCEEVQKFETTASGYHLLEGVLLLSVSQGAREHLKRRPVIILIDLVAMYWYTNRLRLARGKSGPSLLASRLVRSDFLFVLAVAFAVVEPALLGLLLSGLITRRRAMRNGEALAALMNSFTV